MKVNKYLLIKNWGVYSKKRRVWNELGYQQVELGFSTQNGKIHNFNTRRAKTRAIFDQNMIIGVLIFSTIRKSNFNVRVLKHDSPTLRECIRVANNLIFLFELICCSALLEYLCYQFTNITEIEVILFSHVWSNLSYLWFCLLFFYAALVLQ